ncbi:MAG: DUF4129 domain-containing protein [Haloarculaceae archaeon]
MNRTVAAVLALLAVLALGAAAATLEDTATAGGAGGSGGDSGAGVGSGDRFDLGGFNVSESASATPLPDVVGQVVAALLLLVAVFGLYAFYREHGLKGLVTTTAVVTGVMLLLYLLLQGLGGGIDLDGRSGLLGGQEPTLPGGAPSGPESSTVPVADPPTTLLVLFGLVLVGAAAVVFRLTGDDVAEADAEEAAAPAPDVAAVGRAAGRAADRIEAEADVENAVFRAWREMTDGLDVANPASSTPSEFAVAAVDAGMDREDVTELTELFEAVRYGGLDADEDREHRAVDALRRIERTYAEAEFDLPEAGFSGVPADPSTDGTGGRTGGTGGTDRTDGTGGDVT